MYYIVYMCIFFGSPFAYIYIPIPLPLISHPLSHLSSPLTASLSLAGLRGNAQQSRGPRITLTIENNILRTKKPKRYMCMYIGICVRIEVYA